MDIDGESPRRSSCNSTTTTTTPSSPEFEFWMVGNHPELEHNHNLLSADELIVDGVLLPLHLLSLSNSQPNTNIQDTISEQSRRQNPEPEPEPEPAPLNSSSSSSTPCSITMISSKRWKDIFKVRKDPPNDRDSRKKDRKGCSSCGSNGNGNGNGNGGSNGSAELNINIWPFSRSRSAGTAASGRPKSSSSSGAAAMRKSSSAPCSRSNSRGESTASGRRWAASPARQGVGVHVGRASPVWQVKRPGTARNREKVRRGGMMGGGGGGVRGLNLNLGLNVNSCIGYGGPAQGRCRGEDGDGPTTGGGERNDGGGANGGSLFRFRALFSKKVY